jgi:hypothetical protein
LPQGFDAFEFIRITVQAHQDQIAVSSGLAGITQRYK